MDWLKRQVMLFVAAYQRWSQDDGAALAAAVAYYVALSFFPLLLTLIAGVGLFFRFAHTGEDAKRAVLVLVEEHFSSSAGAAVEQALNQVRDTSVYHGPIALIMTFFSSIAGFVQLQQAFDRISGFTSNRRKGIVAAVRMVLFERFVAFVMLCGLGLLIVALFIGGLILAATESYTATVRPGWWAMRRPVRIAIDICINAGLLTLIYRWVPKNPAPFRRCVRGGVVAGVVWEIGRQVLAETLSGAQYTWAYGVLGSFVGLMLWCYYAVAVLLLGAA